MSVCILGLISRCSAREINMGNGISKLKLNPEFIQHSDMNVSAVLSCVHSQVTLHLFGSNAETTDPKVEITFLLCLDL